MRTSEICPRCRLFCIIPPYIFEKMLESKDKATRDAALNSLLLSSQIRGERLATMELGPGVALTTGNARRTIFNSKNSFLLSDAVLARSEDGPASDDGSVNRLFDGLGVTRDFLSGVFSRNSLDDRGGRTRRIRPLRVRVQQRHVRRVCDAVRGWGWGAVHGLHLVS